MGDIILKAFDLKKTYWTGNSTLEVLKGISIEIRKGEVLAVTGPSGVGKSTLLHILGALDRPTSGSVEIDAQDVFSLSDDQLADFRNKSSGFVFQFHHLLPEFTALENVMMPLLICGASFDSAQKTAGELLKRVGLENRLTHKPSELSGGELQRTAVARALVNRPLVVFADEPSGNLDQENSQALHDLMWELSKSLNQSFVIVTHDLELADRADRKISLADGRITCETHGILDEM